MAIEVGPPPRITQFDPEHQVRSRSRPRKLRGLAIWAFGGLLLLGGIGLLIDRFVGRADGTQANLAQGTGSASSPSEPGDRPNRRPQNKAAVKVKVVHPHQGGITRTTSQLAEIRFFAHVQQFAKVSGYLRSQVVDIGDTVRRGDVLAEVFAPEYQQQVEAAAAAVEQSRAEITQAEALVVVSQGEVQAETAMVKQREAQILQYTATRKYRQKEYVRYSELAVNRAIDERAADEKQDDFESAKAGELVSQAAVEAAKGSLARAVAQVEKAKADVKAARARLLVAEARESNARIFQQYTKITAPFDGIVTERNYYDGDFIRDASANGVQPILGLARTDLMRVVVYIPDPQVAYLDRGDDAVVRVLALGGEEFRGKIARYSNMEMASNRAMRAEIDLPNPTGRLRHGMYGDVTILLDKATNLLTVPSSGLIDNDGHGAGSVYVVRGGKARKISVRVGQDNGLVAEILDGVSLNDEIIYDYSGSIEDGSDVDALATSAAGSEKEGRQPH